jgi:hypothetical protein
MKAPSEETMNAVGQQIIIDQLVSALAYLLMDHKQMFPEAHPNSTIRWEECEEVKRAAYAIEYASANRNLG